MPRVGDVGRADQPRVVGEQDGEPGPGDDGLAGRRQVQRLRRPSRVALIDSSATSRAVLTSSIITTHPSRIACTNAESTSCHLPPGPGDRDVVVAEEELVRRRAGLQLDEPVERGAVPVGDLTAAAGPEAVGDRAGDLALAGAGRADQPQERRRGRVVHVEQREGELVDRLRRAGTAGRSACRRAAGSARLAVSSSSGCGWFGGEVSLGGHPVDLRQGSGDCAHARLLA